MRFPRNARIFRGQMEIAPFASVFFLLVIFMMLASVVYTPGVRVQLPLADDLPGTDRPTVTVAMDARGRLYYENQIIRADQLKVRLEEAAKGSPEPLTLIVQADRDVAYDNLMRITLLARDAGIRDAFFAALPRAFATPAASP